MRSASTKAAGPKVRACEMGVMLDVPMRLLLLIALGLTTLALTCVCVEWRPQVGLHTAIIDGVVLYDQYEFATPTVRTYVPSMVFVVI